VRHDCGPRILQVISHQRCPAAASLMDPYYLWNHNWATANLFANFVRMMALLHAVALEQSSMHCPRAVAGWLHSPVTHISDRVTV
jgi:hypothetical protein